MDMDMDRNRVENPGRLSGSDPAPAQSRALAAIAHDLRNPLGVIEFSARVIREHSTETSTLTRQGLEAILRSVHRAERLVNDLLDAAVHDARAFAVQPAWVPAADLLAEAELAGTPLVTAPRMTLTVDRPANLPVVWADSERIAQVFANLIDNAVKFTPPGGRIAVHAVPVPGAVHFSVVDTGPGVKEEDQARVFAPFWQVDPHERRGWGLGLWICRQLVESHGGCLWIESPEDGGAAFVFALRSDWTHRSSV
jgi:signal transduction histidine kinase